LKDLERFCARVFALGTPNGTEVVLWSPAGSRCLSKDWPESVTKDFLDRDK